MAPRRQSGAGERDGCEEARGGSCCVPGECLRPREPVRPDEAVRVLCNNETCTVGRYMHRDCFEQWEGGVLAYLKSCGRARSWSERQRHQNLWTKKGYDLAFKACGCRCGRGHLKKDADWLAPGAGFVGGVVVRAEDDKKRRRRARAGRGSSEAVGALPAAAPGAGRPRALSLSSSGSCSPPSATSESSTSPTHHAHSAKKSAKNDFFSDRVRAGAGANGIFSRRLDFSTFNLLPKHKLNSYHIKMEDEGNHGNDDTRCFILSTLAGQHKPRVSCALCKETMNVFDRYPLVDGTFFLSPLQHTKGAVEVKVEGRTQYLTCVCMGCLERSSPERTIRCRFCGQKWDGSSLVLGTMYSYDIFTFVYGQVKVEGRTQYLTCVCMGCLERSSPERTIRCRFCGQKWDGSSLVLGTMYSYDIFMATPCCAERLKCNGCFKPVLHPQQRLQFYSDYSHPTTCPHCRMLDTHFVKPISYCYARRPYPLYQQWP